MSNLGIALSGESQRVTNKAKGCVGVIDAARITKLYLENQAGDRCLHIRKFQQRRNHAKIFNLFA